MAVILRPLALLAGVVATSGSDEAADLVAAAAVIDDECLVADAETAVGPHCSMSALQLRGTKMVDRRQGDDDALSVEEGEQQTSSDAAGASLAQTAAEEDWFGWSEEQKNPLDAFNDQLDSATFQAGMGLYYEFRTQNSQKIWTGAVEARSGYWADATTVFPLASATKLFTSMAVMRTMQLRPKDWYPDKPINEFPGWESFCCFEVELEVNRSNLTVHHLLTHTSGLPFAMRSNKKDLEKVKLFYKPGTQFGYTLGHRVLAWALRDYWVATPEGSEAGLKTVQDTFRWLMFEKLGLSSGTGFSDTMKTAFGYEGDAGDASLDSTGADMMKLAVVALRRGKLPTGEAFISEENWNRWAVPNKLPGGKLTKDLVNWEGSDASWKNFNFGGLKEQIMQQSGDYGWSYFGGTYYDSKEIGWCGFFSSCLRVTYEHDAAFVMMQRDVSDLKKSKPYVVKHFSEMAAFLRCQNTPCARGGPYSTTVFCQLKDTVAPWTRECPTNATRGKGWGFGHEDYTVDPEHHTCFVPTCDNS